MSELIAKTVNYTMWELYIYIYIDLHTNFKGGAQYAWLLSTTQLSS